jgi:hypothetical protein
MRDGCPLAASRRFRSSIDTPNDVFSLFPDRFQLKRQKIQIQKEKLTRMNVEIGER